MVEELKKLDYKIMGVYTSDIKRVKIKGELEELIPFKTADALKVTMLQASDINNLTTKNISKFELAMQLNKDVIILNDFSMGLNGKEIKYFNLFFKKLVKKYNKQIIILSRDVNYLASICDTIVIYKSGIKYVSKDFYDKKLYEFMDMPNIVRFVFLSSKKHIKLPKTTNPNDLIKAIYRSKYES